MSSTTTKTPTTLTGQEADRSRHAGWLLIGSFLAFAVAVVLVVTMQPAYNKALEDAAAARGVNVNDLPAEAIAPINHQYNALWEEIVFFGVILVALGLYVAAIRAATRVRSDGSRLASAALVGVSLMPIAWFGIFLLETGIGSDDPSAWTGAYDALNEPLIAASTVAGSLALIAVCVLLCRIDVARWTGLVVIALAALVLATAPFVGAPPIMPLLLGAVVGIVMVRTARTAA
jgi:hypothetical protein